MSFQNIVSRSVKYRARKIGHIIRILHNPTELKKNDSWPKFTSPMNFLNKTWKKIVKRLILFVIFRNNVFKLKENSAI